MYVNFFTIFNYFIESRYYVDQLNIRQCLVQVGLENYIKTPTRYSANKNSCIDHIYSILVSYQTVVY